MLNKQERQVIKIQLDKEQKAIDDLERQYKRALKDIDEKIKLLQSDELTQSKVYQIQYQKALKGQVTGILDKLQGDEYATIQQYLHDSYQDGFIGTMYSIHGQGIPLIVPLDQQAAVKAIITDSQINEGLYKHIGVNIKQLKQAIAQEITRGIASNMPFADIARNIANRSKAPLSRAKTIVRTEGHRIQQASANDARDAAKARGCDVVKQWDGTLDGDTRPTHRRLDGQIRETNEPFEMDGKTAMYPGDFGKPEEDCNCRCVALTRAKWALDEDELKTLKERAKFFELDKAKDFEDFEKKYKKAAAKAEKPKTVESINAKATDALLNAYDDRRKHFNMNVVPADELRKSRLNTVTADYTGLSVQTAEAFNDTITRLSDDYYTGFTRIEVADPKKTFGAREFATTQHLNTVGQKTLVINPIRTKDYDKMVEKIEELAQQGYAVKITKGKAGEYIATHEFAHSLLDIGGGSLKNYVGLDVKTFQKARKEIEAVFAQYAKEVNDLERIYKDLEGKFLLADDIDDMADLQREVQKAKERLDKVKISKYSMQNADEFMAEAFVDVKIGEHTSEWSEKATAIVDKYFKKSKQKLPETLKKQAKRDIIKVKNSDLENGLPIKGTPGSVVDKTDDAGATLQRRIYGDDGMAHIDYDTSDHGLPKAHPTGAHKHEYDYTKKVKRSKPLKLTEDELQENEDIIKKGVNYHDEEDTD